MLLPDDKEIPGKPDPALDSFTGDPVNEYSIGDGSSDQGFEPGEELRDDEFRHGNPSTGEQIDNIKEEVLDKENLIHARAPTHGLVEEGPGPDA
jgi:hypothetical protein